MGTTDTRGGQRLISNIGSQLPPAYDRLARLQAYGNPPVSTSCLVGALGLQTSDARLYMWILRIQIQVLTHHDVLVGIL